MAIIYGLKVNLSVTMVAMLNHTAIEHESHAAQSISLNKSVLNDVETCEAPGGETIKSAEVSFLLLVATSYYFVMEARNFGCM